MSEAPPPAPDPAIEADPELSTDESDSTMGDDVWVAYSTSPWTPNIDSITSSRYTASLTSSIQRYPVENNRRYHATDVSYVMPNDEAELDRLDLTHQKLKILLEDRLLLCPVQDPKRVLDVGTGTGIWAIEYGDDHADTDIIGTDLSPTQPSWVPPNVKFEVDDCEEPWTFRENFDVVHCRYLAAAIQDWPQLIAQAFQFTKPGGYSEFQDYDLVYYSEDGTLTDDLPIQKWITTLLAAARDFGRDPCPGPKLAGYMRDAGFKDVQERKYKIPIGPWAKDKHLKTIGAWNLVQIEDGLEAFTLRLFTQVLGWKSDEVQVLLANVRKDLRNPKIHAQFDL
ncbi:MAG: hypothetical protein Q9224_004447 [Gallowayella concinna]